MASSDQKIHAASCELITSPTQTPKCWGCKLALQTTAAAFKVACNCLHWVFLWSWDCIVKQSTAHLCTVWMVRSNHRSPLAWWTQTTRIKVTKRVFTQMSACVCNKVVPHHKLVAKSQAVAQHCAAHLYRIGRISHSYWCCDWHMLAVGVSHQWGEPTPATACWLLGSCKYIDKLWRVRLWLSRQFSRRDHTIQHTVSHVIKPVSRNWADHGTYTCLLADFHARLFAGRPNEYISFRHTDLNLSLIHI